MNTEIVIGCDGKPPFAAAVYPGPLENAPVSLIVRPLGCELPSRIVSIHACRSSSNERPRGQAVPVPYGWNSHPPADASRTSADRRGKSPVFADPPVEKQPSSRIAQCTILPTLCKLLPTAGCRAARPAGVRLDSPCLNACPLAFMPLDLASSTCGGCDPDRSSFLKAHVECRAARGLCQVCRLRSHPPAQPQARTHGAAALIRP